MIQIRRGITANWRKTKTELAEGQPGYDKSKHKLKIGDGETSWYDLPYATGLFAEEILNDEATAKKRKNADSEDDTIITYGTKSPDKNTIGQLYLQYYDTAPEVDYIVESGKNKGWTYQKWNSGIAKCWGRFKVEATTAKAVESVMLYHSDKHNISYPFTFEGTPCETATLQSSGNTLIWLASAGENTNKTSGSYRLISTDKHTNKANYYISLSVAGRWK